MPLYAQYAVPFLWLLDPIARTLEVFRLESGRWSLQSTHADDDRVRPNPSRRSKSCLPIFGGNKVRTTVQRMNPDFEKDPRFIKNLKAWTEITGLCLNLKERYIQGQSPSLNSQEQLFLELRKLKEKRWRRELDDEW